MSNKINHGSSIAVCGLAAGMLVLGIVSGSAYRLVSDQASAAALAAAENTTNQAETLVGLADTALQPDDIGNTVTSQIDKRSVADLTAQSGHGIPGEGLAQRYHLITDDDIDAIAMGLIARGYRLAHKFGGPTMTGARIAAEFSAIHEAKDNPDNEVKQGVALTGSAYGWASGGWGGTALSPKGALYGGNSIVTTINGYTHTENITSHEFNTQMETGSSTHYKSGIQVVSRDQILALGPDVGVAVSAIGGALGYKQALSFGDMNGSPPVPTSGTLIGDYTRLGGDHTAAAGIDFTHWLFTQYLMRFKTWSLLPTGSSLMGGGSGQVQIDGRTHTWDSGSVNDFDARLAFTGGQNNQNGGGVASLVAALFSVGAKMEVANVAGLPDSNNHWTISMDSSGAYLRWKDENGDDFIMALGTWTPAP